MLAWNICIISCVDFMKLRSLRSFRLLENACNVDECVCMCLISYPPRPLVSCWRSFLPLNYDVIIHAIAARPATALPQRRSVRRKYIYFSRKNNFYTVGIVLSRRCRTSSFCHPASTSKYNIYRYRTHTMSTGRVKGKGRGPDA